MATASSSLHQSIFRQYPCLPRNSGYIPPLRFSSSHFPSRIRASSAVALEPVFHSFSLLVAEKALQFLSSRVSRNWKICDPQIMFRFNMSILFFSVDFWKIKFPYLFIYSFLWYLIMVVGKFTGFGFENLASGCLDRK